MKKIIYITLALMATLQTSCELVDVVDLEPQDVLIAETAIRDQTGAELALAGAYDYMNDGGINFTYLQTSVFGIEAVSARTPNSYDIHDVSPFNGWVTNLYGDYYGIINRVNYIIDIVPTLDDNLFEPGKKDNIVGQAKFLRAFFNHYLLRRWGQFWDLNSEYGIVIREKPATDVVAIPRSTVQQSYDYIINDLDDAISRLTLADNPEAYFSNSFSAKGLKARILLYMGKYAEAAALADEVIKMGPFELEETFEDVFVYDDENNRQFNTSEAMFVGYYDEDETNVVGTGWWFYLDLSPYYLNFARDQNDTRVEYVDFNSRNGKKRVNSYSTNFYLRLAEMYFIYAEGLARSNGELSEISKAINTIRNRANMPNTTASTREELLVAIREEKLLEMAAEEFEPWYDAIRYSVLDGLDLSEIKEAITDETKFILPIPNSSVEGSNNIVVQNPGY